MHRYTPLSDQQSDGEEEHSSSSSASASTPLNPNNLPEPDSQSNISWGTWFYKKIAAAIAYSLRYQPETQVDIHELADFEPHDSDSSDPETPLYDNSETFSSYGSASRQTINHDYDADFDELRETVALVPWVTRHSQEAWDALCLRINTDVTRFQDSPEGIAAGLGWRIFKDVTIPPIISITVAAATFELMQIIAGGLGINTQMRLANTFAKYPTWVIAIVTQVIANLHRNRYRPDIIKPLYDKAIDPLYRLLMPIIDTLGITAFLNQLSMATIAWIIRISTDRSKGSAIFIPNAAAYSSIATGFALAVAAARLNRLQEILDISGALNATDRGSIVRFASDNTPPLRAQAISRLNGFDRFLLHKVSRMGFYGITAMATFHQFFFDMEELLALDTEAPWPFWIRMVLTFLPAFIAGYLQYQDKPSDSRLMTSFNGLQTFMTIALILVTFLGYIYGAPPETQVYSDIVEVLSYLWPTLLALSTGFVFVNVVHDWPQITNQQPLADEKEPIGLDRRLGSRRPHISSGTTLFSRSSSSVGASGRLLTGSKSTILSINGLDEVLRSPVGDLNDLNPAAPSINGPDETPHSSDDDSNDLSPPASPKASQPGSSGSILLVSHFKSTSSLLSREEEHEGSVPKANAHKFLSMQPST